MKHVSPAALKAAGAIVASHLSVTTAQKFDVIIAALEAHGDRPFALLHRFEFDAHPREQPIKNTILEPVADALGIKATTVGEVMDAVPLTDTDVHCLACDCHVGSGEPIIRGIDAAMVMRARKQRL